jgi:hypothetical protein
MEGDMEILIKLFFTAFLFFLGFLGCLISAGEESRLVMIGNKGVAASLGCVLAIAVLIVWAV